MRDCSCAVYRHCCDAVIGTMLCCFKHLCHEKYLDDLGETNVIGDSDPHSNQESGGNAPESCTNN